MDKDQMRAWREQHDDPFCGLLCTDPSEISFMGSSSGTTGDPTLFCYRWGPDDGNLPAGPGCPRTARRATGADAARLVGDRPQARRARHLLRAADARPMFRLLQMLGVTPIMLGYGAGDLTQFVDLSRRYRPTVFYAMTAFLGAGLQEIERTMGVDMRDVFASYKGILFAGRAGGARRCGQTFERWGLAGKIFNQTSFGDLGHAHDCREHDGCHAWEDIGVAEIVDPDTGRADRGQPPRRVGLQLARQPARSAAALPRWRHRRPAAAIPANAVARMRASPLSAAAPTRRLIDGRSILPMDVWGAIEDVPETSHGLFQIVRPQRLLDELKIRVGYAGTPELARLRERVADSVEAAVGIRPLIELVPNDVVMQSGSRHKIPRTVKQ
jgi:phenylacetate-CoA ligase